MTLPDQRKSRRRIPAHETPTGLALGDDAVTDWPTVRAWVLERDGHLCQICHQRPASDVDHIWPRRLGGTDHIDNLRAACGPCNKAKGDRVDISAASGEQLNLAVFELGRRLDELEAEQYAFLNEVLIRGLAERADLHDLALALKRIQHTLDLRRTKLQAVADRLSECARRLTGFDDR